MKNCNKGNNSEILNIGFYTQMMLPVLLRFECNYNYSNIKKLKQKPLCRWFKLSLYFPWNFLRNWLK